MKERPDVFFLQKTKVRSSSFSSNKFKFGFPNAFVVDCVGKSGGLALLWKDDVDFEVSSYFPNHIHGRNGLGTKGGNWFTHYFLIGVYGHPSTNFRPDVWKLICSFNRNMVDRP